MVLNATFNNIISSVGECNCTELSITAINKYISDRNIRWQKRNK